MTTTTQTPCDDWTCGAGRIIREAGAFAGHTHSYNHVFECDIIHLAPALRQDVAAAIAVNLGAEGWEVAGGPTYRDGHGGVDTRPGQNPALTHSCSFNTKQLWTTDVNGACQGCGRTTFIN